MRRLLAITVLLLIFQIPAFAQLEMYNHPELKWQSFETPNFVVHFHQGTKRSALLIAKIAEDIHPHLTKLYNYKPNGKIHFIIKDTDDYSNGGAFFFDDKIEIWANSLDYIMRGTRNWLRDVVTHEYAHMISIQKMVKTNLTVPYGFLQIFAYEKERRKDVVRGFPNGIVSYPISSVNIPVWFAEGVAQHQAPGSRYDYRDPHREMILRDRIMRDQMLTYNSMAVFGKDSHGNESAYNLGFSFVNYLTGRFGEDVLEKLTAQSAKWNAYTFDGVVEDVTGFTGKQLYSDWKDSLTTVYSSRLKTIEANLVKGGPVELNGTANIYPTWSPDGTKIAWVSNKGQDYFSFNRLIVLDKQTGKQTNLTPMITSSLSWSPDGRYLAYARQEHDRTGSSYNDLYVYDFEEKKEIRLSKGLRGTNPDFSNDGKRLSFVSAANGLHQLNVLHLPDGFTGDFKNIIFYDKETGELVPDKNSAKDDLREVKLLGGKVEQLLAFRDNRQIYHPRWSNDDRQIVFDTAVEYGRNIGQYDFASGTFSLLLEAEEELRYPAFQKGSPYLYYAASSTGIYNIYRRNLETGQTELYTNVPGGAMMPSVTPDGQMVYACYDSIGYKIYEIDQPEAINPELAVYDPGYIASIPDKNFDDAQLSDPEVKPYRQTFTPIHILPRILFDYGTVKPGFYIISTDVLDKYTLLAGAATNTDLDYDLYGLFEVREFKPTLYLEVYNMSANIEDNLSIPDGRESILYRRDITFDLTEFRLGLTGKVYDLFDYRVAYARRSYNAKINQDAGIKNGQKVDISFTFHYNYLKGSAIEASIFSDMVHPNRNSEINPNAGRYFFLRYSYEMSDLIEDFAINLTGIDEIYTKYRYNQIELDWEEFFKNPFLENHAFSLRLKGGYIDRKVDSFFNFFAGGLIGMKGYSFYSIEGRQKLIGTFTYRLPLFENIDTKFGHFYFDKLYLGLFTDYGNAWNPADFDIMDFKRDVGIQLRLDSFSYNLFPTRFFAEAVYPLDQAKNYDDSREKLIAYPREWRYYFGALFEFDLRERVTQLMDGNRWLRRLRF